ncbi:BadF/BadG/BcrA/BcrD ATPase family protein [Streptomyces sp. NPDC020802]|uniref:BadF/BadG/BcrA/BcrD ATPase family protein n=1 Tax=Streptomyces sp. NPDC020802 TaxID=3365094 RepID=UPI00379BABAD
MNNDLNQDLAQDLVVGLDAGGTRTRAVLAAAVDGRVLREGAAGPGNALTVPVPRLTDHLAEAIAGAVPDWARARVVAVAGGFAGAAQTSPDEPGRLNALAALTAALRRLGIAPGSIGVSSDIEAAFASAPGAPADGLALVAGTGAVAIRIEDRRCAVTVDGDGWLLGDDGSGFWIGRSAVRAALRMADGRGASTALADMVGRALEVPTEARPPAGRAAGPAHADAAHADSAPVDSADGDPADAGRGGRGRGGRARDTDGEDAPGDAERGAPGHSAAVHGEGGPGEGARAEGGVRAEDRRTDACRGDGGPGAGRAGRIAVEPGWARDRREAYRMHLLPAVMAGPPILLARLAPLVAEAARAGDPVAEAILDEAVDHLLDTVRALEPRPGEPMVATGGLLGPDGPLTVLLSERLWELGLRLDWVADGCRGAVALARLGHGRPASSAPAT